jgi:hypothetical protein
MGRMPKKGPVTPWIRYMDTRTLAAGGRPWDCTEVMGPAAAGDAEPGSRGHRAPLLGAGARYAGRSRPLPHLREACRVSGTSRLRVDGAVSVHVSLRLGDGPLSRSVCAVQWQVVLVGAVDHDRLRVHLRLHPPHAAALHQLQAQERLAPALALPVLQVSPPAGSKQHPPTCCSGGLSAIGCRVAGDGDGGVVRRFLNTFIDDLFAFIIRMPTMHRISCFRDDVVSHPAHHAFTRLRSLSWRNGMTCCACM